MRRIHAGPDRLILRHSATLAALSSGGGTLGFAGMALTRWAEKAGTEAAPPAILAAICAALFAALARREEVIFDRESGRVTLSSLSVFGRRTDAWPLARLDRAILGLDPSEAGTPEPRLARVELTLSDGARIPLSAVYRSGAGAEDAVRAVNAWLEGRY